MQLKFGQLQMDFCSPKAYCNHLDEEEIIKAESKEFHFKKYV